MKYALLIYSKPGSHEALSPEEYQSALGEYQAISDDARCVAGAQLQPVETATTVRVDNGSTDGELVRLEDQDRSRWDLGEIEAGRELLDRAIALRGRGTYVLQAAIVSLQSEEEIDWAGIVRLYDQLVAVTGSPVVELNRAVALSQAGSSEAALAIVDQLDLDAYRYLHSTRAELLRRVGRDEEARAAYQRAVELAASEAEKRFLARRLAEL